ncbi:MAG: cystathionine beta-synthase [Fulvivirga sp.]|uniref:cystathionine beta-synthase n=1 Tax=Fulvivirga sp. TaxID=1931237 RepID=UPI0032EF4315
MENTQLYNYIKNLLANLPADWLNLTTHRLDIYHEELAKTEFIEEFEKLYAANNTNPTALNELPTAYDYIRLGHPLSSVLEWAIAKANNLQTESVISFSSRITPILAVLRKNLLSNKNTQIVYTGELPAAFDADTIKKVYGYNFELKQVANSSDIPDFDGSTVFISQQNEIGNVELHSNIDFFISDHASLGSIIIVNGAENRSYISEIQHVRRRETIAMTPANCLTALQHFVGAAVTQPNTNVAADKKLVTETIKNITATSTTPLVGSSGLSVQYALMMGLIEYAQENHPGKDIRFLIPPNCYGGTNDQARRIAACLKHVEILDLPVDRDNNMVQSTERVLEQVAKEDAVPFIIVEIPTNPRVEVPDLDKLTTALSKERKTANGNAAIAPVFIIDQTFCPNVQFLKEGGLFSSINTLSYVSGSKFPSGGKCTAGYCVANNAAKELMPKIEKHLTLCDNEATDLQLAFLAEQLPSMNQRIADAYKNTREFVNFIQEALPTAKINFVSEELAKEGFTPSVFSLDLPTKGNTDEERETYKRALNNKLINLMISEIPNESKYCVSYGQLKGCYWTIPATSTQGTTKESDKDYIARVALSANMDLERHKKVFQKFVEGIW